MNKSYKAKKEKWISKRITGENQTKNKKDLYIFNGILKNFKMNL